LKRGRFRKTMGYTINVSVGSKLHIEKVSIPDGRMCTYIHHIRRDMVGEVSLAIYKQGGYPL